MSDLPGINSASFYELNLRFDQMVRKLHKIKIAHSMAEDAMAELVIELTDLRHEVGEALIKREE